MTSGERERLNALCVRIQQENDPKKFTKLLTELDRLLDEQERVMAKTGKEAEITTFGLR